MTVDPQLIVVLGATGDLMKRKLLPVLYKLTRAAAGGCRILAVSRSREITDQSFREVATESLKKFAGVSADDAAAWASKHLFFQAMGRSTLEDYRALAMRIREVEAEHNLGAGRVFYLALPPAVFPRVIVGLGEAGLNRAPNGWTRLVVEKPFGTDLTSAQSLNDLVHRHFDESQVYRIDHYLGKETVQNLLAFRFGNAIFESLWNRDRVERIEITVAESLGVEGRAGYYDTSGALRDMVQNHLTQLLTLTAMEVPAHFDANSIRHEKEKVLRSLMPLQASDVVYGQYTAGDGDVASKAYLEEPGVKADSRTETFVAMRLRIENWRWQGVPFLLRTGKRLARRVSQIVVTFRQAPIALFGDIAAHSNRLVITLQPDEGFDLHFDAKVPGDGFELKTQRLHFRYEEAFGTLPGAYETLLLDIMTGDQTLFVHADEVESSWRLYTPLLETPAKIHPYSAGTWGPEVAQELGEWWAP